MSYFSTPLRPVATIAQRAAGLLSLAAVAVTVSAEFDYAYAPQGDWGVGTPNPTLSITATGETSPVDAMDGVSTYLHGQWHTDLGQSVTFVITTPEDGIVGLEVGEASSSGTNNVTIQEGSTVLSSRSFSQGTRDPAQTLEAPLPAGAHTITFTNSGQDWVSVNQFYFKSADGSTVTTGELDTFSWDTGSPRVYDKVEASFALDRDYANPYDPDTVQVDALVSGPDGIQYELPAFWYAPVTWDNVAIGEWANFQAPGNPTWKLRFAPSTVGQWSVAIRVTDAQGTTTSALQTIDVYSSNQPGFVRLDAADRQGYRFDNGDPYIPIGFNLCWNGGSLSTMYDQYMERMEANGVNWMRYWMTPFARQSIEWGADHWSGLYGGLGQYAQGPAALLDHVVERAEQDDIRIQLVLEHHGLYSANVNPQWSENPYNTANGGYLSTPGAFFSDADAIAQAQKKYRYIVARWGYSSAIFAWELFNEVNFTGGTSQDIGAWHNTMTAYLKSIDPYGHIVTTSTTQSQLDLSTELDLVQEHTYSSNIATSVANLDDTMLSHFDRPVMVGEYGTSTAYGSSEEPTHPDLWGDHVRQTTWIGTMKRVPNMFWFWTEYLWPYDLFDLYGPVTSYWEGEDLGAQANLGEATYNWLNDPAYSSTDAYGLRSDSAVYFYARDTRFGNWAASAETISGARLQLSNLVDGIYTVRYTHPVSGEVETSGEVTVSGGSVTLTLPDFSKDIALKLKQLPAVSTESYTAWRDRVFTTAEIDAGLGDADATASSDGIANLYKYAAGDDTPQHPLPEDLLPRLQSLDGATVLTFPTAQANVTYIVESSTDGGSWSEVTRVAQPEHITTNVNVSTSQTTYWRVRVALN
ncbi:MAG: hypothetical protein E1N59_1650 [Puniceicoccaceae bacterium 5H]|nr:MAG: hypothetical protein E1N59_1650 [Puniceicoccaceae bacterium 5H]